MGVGVSEGVADGDGWSCAQTELATDTAPTALALASVTNFDLRDSRRDPLLRIISLISSMELRGHAACVSAAIPATCGHAIEVPESVPYDAGSVVLYILPPGAAMCTVLAP